MKNNKKNNETISLEEIHQKMDVFTIKKRILSFITNAPDSVDEETKGYLSKLVDNELNNLIHVSESKQLTANLDVLFNYQKNYLELIKEYKEEIKFVNTIQEDLRRERAKFFAQNLQEVHETLEKASIDKEQSSIWIKELVESYTKSIDLSSELVKIQVTETVEKLKSDSDEIINSLKNNS